MAAWRLTLSVCVCVSLCVSEVRGGSYVSAKMNQTIHSLLRRYKTQEVFNGKPVFPRPFMTGKTETKMVLMGGVLQTYDTLIGRMLDRLPTSSPDVQQSESAVASDAVALGSSSMRNELTYIRGKIQELKNIHFKEQEKLLQRLQDLGQIQMDNQVIQHKALWELLPLYEEASELSNSVMMRRRRRRQTKGLKLPYP
ncbi:interferon gamma-like [Gouania willdenowi]|uniref:Interferon gamma-like n=1 Tax=Gouania willdenowi TaxID=441366 RepID=A0A8C5D0Q4_GOUWI|nr:interferon gamma-like [Gouania willdenowi]